MNIFADRKCWFDIVVSIWIVVVPWFLAYSILDKNRFWFCNKICHGVFSGYSADKNHSKPPVGLAVLLEYLSLSNAWHKHTQTHTHIYRHMRRPIFTFTFTFNKECGFINHAIIKEWCTSTRSIVVVFTPVLCVLPMLCFFRSQKTRTILFIINYNNYYFAWCEFFVVFFSRCAFQNVQVCDIVVLLFAVGWKQWSLFCCCTTLPAIAVPIIYNRS